MRARRAAAISHVCISRIFERRARLPWHPLLFSFSSSSSPHHPSISIARWKQRKMKGAHARPHTRGVELHICAADLFRPPADMTDVGRSIR